MGPNVALAGAPSTFPEASSWNKTSLMLGTDTYLPAQQPGKVSAKE